LDQGVGRVLAALESTGRAENALVIFCSDNGAYPIAASNAPFRGYASELFEGGIHVACMARWPGKIPPGITDDRLTMTFDLTASLFAASGVTPPPDRPLDGIDILGQIAKGEPAQSRTLFWRARRAERTWRAVRLSDLKYLSRQDGESLEEFLFDLKTDPGETRNLLSTKPKAASNLKQKLAAWEKDVHQSPARRERIHRQSSATR
jgi:N-acetylgalactosamine-6-sulfatase